MTRAASTHRTSPPNHRRFRRFRIPGGPRDSRIRGNSAPATPRISRHNETQGLWQNSPALGFGGGIGLSERAFARICAHLIPYSCPHLRAKTLGNFQNLPDIYRIFRKFVFLRTNRAAPPSYRNPPRARVSQMRANAWLNPGDGAGFIPPPQPPSPYNSTALSRMMRARRSGAMRLGRAWTGESKSQWG